jgi:hypothetical protein
VGSVLQFDEATGKRHELLVVDHSVKSGLDLLNLEVDDELGVGDVLVDEEVGEFGKPDGLLDFGAVLGGKGVAEEFAFGVEVGFGRG